MRLDESRDPGGAREQSDLPGKTAVILNSLPLWVTALSELAASSNISVVGSAFEPARALRLISELRPTLFITEIDVGDEGDEGDTANLDVVREARRIAPDLRIIVLSKQHDPTCINAAFAAGADVYALKKADPIDLAAGIRQAFGQSFFVASQWRAAASVKARAQRDSNPATLTRRELEILQLVAEGHTNGLMASMLWVTEQTIKFHLSNIYRKLKVSNRTEASRWAQLNGLLPLKPDTNDPDASSAEDPEVAAHQVSEVAKRPLTRPSAPTNS
jgi:DNA-binding NarL/FixJ family response regulator